jgi:septum formation protein
MLSDKLNQYRLILASKSPRRRELITELGLTFEIITSDSDESFPDDMPVFDVPGYLAEQKALPFENRIDDNTLVITADTIVYIDGKILGKPVDDKDAFTMLRLLSGKWHQVATGVCLLTKTKKVSFTSRTSVLFKELTDEEINFYVTNYKPFDKAGAYGIQEWIGYVAVEQIQGSYFNVMGLPVQQLYEELCKF